MATRPDMYEEDAPEEEREFDVGEPDEVEVEVADEDAEPAADSEAEETEEQPPAEVAEDANGQPKPKFRADKRISELARQKAELEAELARERAEAARLREERDTERVANVRSMEAGLKAELDAAKRKLADAHVLGDGQAIADATEEVGRLAADLATVRAYSQQPPKREETRQEQQQPQQVKVEPRTQAWIEANPWFVPGTQDYDPELAVDAQAFAKKLEIRLQREGRAAEIGSADYFRQIDDYMAKTYPDVFEADEPAPTQRKMPAMKANQEVAPAARQSPTAAPARKGNVVKLTAQEKEMAERFHPNLPPQKAWAEYARYK